MDGVVDFSVNEGFWMVVVTTVLGFELVVVGPLLIVVDSECVVSMGCC